MPKTKEEMCKQPSPALLRQESGRPSKGNRKRQGVSEGTRAQWYQTVSFFKRGQKASPKVRHEDFEIWTTKEKTSEIMEPKRRLFQTSGELHTAGWRPCSSPRVDADRLCPVWEQHSAFPCVALCLLRPRGLEALTPPSYPVCPALLPLFPQAGAPASGGASFEDGTALKKSSESI